MDIEKAPEGRFEKEYKNWFEVMKYLTNNEKFKNMDFDKQKEIRTIIKFSIFDELKIRNMKYLRTKDLELTKKIANDIILDVEG